MVDRIVAESEESIDWREGRLQGSYGGYVYNGAKAKSRGESVPSP